MNPVRTIPSAVLITNNDKMWLYIFEVSLLIMGFSTSCDVGQWPYTILDDIKLLYSVSPALW